MKEAQDGRTCTPVNCVPPWYYQGGTRSFSDMSYPVRELRTLRKEWP
jgi:hypothetical protein